MTKIKYKDKPVWHETSASYNGREVVVAQTPVNLLLRLKGTRGGPQAAVDVRPAAGGDDRGGRGADPQDGRAQGEEARRG